MYMGRLDPDFLVPWALGVTCGAVAAGFELRTLSRVRGRLPARVIAYVTALMPLAALLLSVLYFRVGRAPVRQLNTDEPGVAWFSTWSTVWHVLMLGLLAATTSSIAFAFTRTGRTRRACWFAVLVGCLLGLHGVFANFPDV